MIVAGFVQNAPVPANMLESLKTTAAETQRVNPLSIGGGADSSKLRDKFVQRGAASFVAQLRDTKENSDMLVSLILTKEMLLVAKKPSYKTMYTLKYAEGLKAFPVPKDHNGVIVISSELDEPLMFGCGQAKLFQETLEAFVTMSGCANPNPLHRPEVVPGRNNVAVAPAAPAAPQGGGPPPPPPPPGAPKVGAGPPPPPPNVRKT